MGVVHLILHACTTFVTDFAPLILLIIKDVTDVTDFFKKKVDPLKKRKKNRGQSKNEQKSVTSGAKTFVII